MTKKSRARKTSEQPTRIWSYRILPPEDPAHRKIVDDQFFLAHQYRARLCEIEIELSNRFRQIDLDHPDTCEARCLWEGQSQLLDALYADLRAIKSGTAPEDREDEEVRQQIMHIKPECGAAWRSVKTARQLAHVAAHHAPRYVEVREWANAQVRIARGEFSARGLVHGSYIRVETAVRQSIEATGRPPEFRRYEGEGSIGRQLPRVRDSADQLHSVTIDDLYAGEDSRVRLTALPAGWEDLARTARRRIAKTYRGQARRQKAGDGWQEIPARLDGQYLEMQFGHRPAERESTWVRFPLTHHRRMPADAVVLWVYIVRRRIGIHYEWRAQFTIESDTFQRPTAPRAPAQTCAMDIGWRRIFDPQGNQVGLRVAYLVDEHGAEREIRAPDGLWQDLARVYAIASTRSRDLDAIRTRLVMWLAGKPMPEWFETVARGLPQWRAPRKMQRLIDTWQKPEHRVPGDEAILEELHAWARTDRGRGSAEAHLRDRTIAHRREVWRQTASDLARTYRTILVEDGLCRSEGREQQLKITAIEGWDRPAPEDGDPHEGREQRRQSRMAAPGELRLAITQACQKTASSVIDVASTRKSTCECAWCGHDNAGADFAGSIKIQCAACGRAWDQDANAARNLLHRKGYSSGPVPGAPPAASGAVHGSDGTALASDNSATSRRNRGERVRKDANALSI